MFNDTSTDPANAIKSAISRITAGRRSPEELQSMTQFTAKLPRCRARAAFKLRVPDNFVAFHLTFAECQQSYLDKFSRPQGKSLL